MSPQPLVYMVWLPLSTTCLENSEWHTYWSPSKDGAYVNTPSYSQRRSLSRVRGARHSQPWAPWRDAQPLTRSAETAVVMSAYGPLTRAPLSSSMAVGTETTGR